MKIPILLKTCKQVLCTLLVIMKENEARVKIIIIFTDYLLFFLNKN